jgi:hypothetical protein
MKQIIILGESWPDTGRKFPQDAEFKVFTSEKYRDLTYKRGQDYVYLSTLLVEKIS